MLHLLLTPHASADCQDARCRPENQEALNWWSAQPGAFFNPTQADPETPTALILQNPTEELAGGISKVRHDQNEQGPADAGHSWFLLPG